ncbi:MAG TPA: EamA family transporter, partial [bacterium]|nr:EamA family transporter [bacterium]
MAVRTLVFTLFALVCFAANSILCRLALGDGTIDAASFASLRVLSGTVALLLLLAVTRSGRGRPAGDWRSG